MISRIAKLASACTLLLGSIPVLAQERVEVAPENWTIQVVHLGYADAFEVAEVLQQVLPPGVTVVPYYATNSLIFAGDADVIATLTAPAGSNPPQSRPQNRPASGEIGGTIAALR